MAEQFKKHLAKFVKINEVDFPEILNFFQLIHVKKKENLVTEGNICRCQYFVLEGCLRMFFIKENGIEQTTQFAIENWWMTDLFAFENQGPATFNIQAVEKSVVLAIDYLSYEKLLQQFPQMERYFRFVYQRAFASSQIRMKYHYDFSKEEMYLHFRDNFPEFLQRVPQYLLASYLGFTPEYLSEIRNKTRS
ncbi:Crp/Fnr family transcriptional regulator [Chitinophagaceae bacterium LB-8]|jgi:CRP-like cAMP-binding protein|uniref:Crp/Fnr family transcriptional regulator n=1 Tax=Paraflavisolibacter caeni TaxID=2982496 RepID=A0A9X2XT14_9BACT|nr:Crp/Fnr family transcriptional regulator [Paraflavisolibacter caeni]MCU7548250.1 Crp/Fnr family transcriptional regulator [Paraflavisolibacter caeni]